MWFVPTTRRRQRGGVWRPCCKDTGRTRAVNPLTQNPAGSASAAHGSYGSSRTSSNSLRIQRFGSEPTLHRTFFLLGVLRCRQTQTRFPGSVQQTAGFWRSFAEGSILVFTSEPSGPVLTRCSSAPVNVTGSHSGAWSGNHHVPLSVNVTGTKPSCVCSREL